MKNVPAICIPFLILHAVAGFHGFAEETLTNQDGAFPGAIVHGEWVNVPGLGWLYAEHAPVYWQQKHGWIYGLSNGEHGETTFFWSYRGSYWFWLDLAAYPNAYRYDLSLFGAFHEEEGQLWFESVGDFYPDASMLRYKVQTEPTHTIDRRLFGQFLERPSWDGETGPEAIFDRELGKLPENVISKLQEMNPTVVRFPGGTDVDRIDWTDMIDNAPGRDPGEGRPITLSSAEAVTNDFGYDEYFALRDTIGFEALIVVNLDDVLRGNLTNQEGALRAAGLVAYCNAAVGATLPEGMPDWPAIRALNGSEAPFGVPYWQIGNEIWLLRTILNHGGAPAFLDTLKLYVEAMKAVDPTIQLVLDGQLGNGIEEEIFTDPFIREHINFITFHDYGPWAYSNRILYGDPRPGTEAWWRYWVLQPSGRDAQGRAKALGDRMDRAIELGYAIACTEWNWNGWGFDGLNPRPSARPEVTMALGSASFIHGMFREGEHLKLATQSMLLGVTWGITAIRAPDHLNQGKFEPWLLPQAQATRFYNEHHGAFFLPVEPQSELPWFKLPRADAHQNGDKANAVDLVASTTGNTVWLHTINFHRTRAFPVEVVFEQPYPATPSIRMRIMSGPQNMSLSSNRQILNESMGTAAFHDGILKFTLPAASFSVIEISSSEN